MRILYVGMDATPYGDRSLEVRVADELARRGHEVHLVTERMPRYQDGERPESMTNYVMPVNRGLSLAEKSRLIASHPTVVFGSSASALPLITELASRLSIPSVCQFLDIPVWRLKYDQWKAEWEPRFKAASQLDAIVVNHSITLSYAKKLISPTPSVHLIHYGMDSETADGVPSPPQEEPYIIFVGRLVWYKGVDQLLYALRGTDISLKIVGDGPEAFRLKETALMAGVHAEFLGPISDRMKFALIKGARFGVYPNICEFIGGLFPLEALYCGKPCIVYDIPVSREIYRGCVSYTPAYDVNQLRFDIGYLWEETFLENGAGRDFVSKERTFKVQAARLEEVLEGLA